MNSFLDIYVKLVIAVISFIAPIIVYMLSVFGDGIAIISRKAKEEEYQITNLLRVQADSQGQLDAKIIKRSSKLLQDSEKENKRRLNLLTPHRQIVRVFCPLILALVLIMFDMVVKDPYFNMYNHTFSVGLIGLSFISFGIGILWLKQVAWTIIDTKRVISEDKAAVNVGVAGD